MEAGTRAGTQALCLIAEPLNVAVLDALASGPRALLDLVRAAGFPPRTTMRGKLRTLDEIGVLDKRRQNEFPGTIDFDLAGSGRELRSVAEVVQLWLAACPEGPVTLGTVAAKSAIKALVDAWSTSMIRALAARPLSLTELDRVIANVSYPSLERRLSALRLAGLVARMPGQGRGTPYVATPWLRQAVAPLTAAARWERRHLRDTGVPVTNRDAEAAFLLALPLLSLPAELSGVCRFALEFPNGSNSRLAGVLVEVDAGRIASCVSRLEGNAEAWASGSSGDWFEAVIDRDQVQLEVGGDCNLAGALLDGLHDALFGSAQVEKR